MALYGCGNNALNRWRKESGKPAQIRNQWGPCEPRQPKANKPKKGIWRHWNGTPSAAPDASLSGRAADHLRKYFAPVCRLVTINPKADPNLYRVGRQTMTSGEMLDLAEAKGFDPNEWSRVA